MTNKRGGKREGAGRKSTGTTKKVSITLADETWEQIEQTKQDEKISQSAVLREIIENNFSNQNQNANDERAVMWWELVRKNIFQGFIEIKKDSINKCIQHRKYSKELAFEVYDRCVANSKAYKKPRVSYLLEAFLFEGKRLLLDENFASIEEQIIHSIIEYVRLNRNK